MELVPMVVRLAPPAGSGGGGGGGGGELERAPEPAVASSDVDVDRLEEEVVVVRCADRSAGRCAALDHNDASTQTHVSTELEFLEPVTSTQGYEFPSQTSNRIHAGFKLSKARHTYRSFPFGFRRP